MNTRFVIWVFLLAALASCRKTQLNEETITTQDGAIAEKLYADLFNVTTEVASRNDEQNPSVAASAPYFLGECTNVTIYPAWPDSTFPKVISVSFGEEGCVGRDGRVRRGDIRMVISDFYRNRGSIISTTTSNYVVDDFQVTGAQTIVNRGASGQGANSYEVTVSDGLITGLATGYDISWESSYLRQWIAGSETSIFSQGFSGLTDDVYLVTGASHGINRDGRDFSWEITDPLVISVGCRWVAGGEVMAKPDDLRERHILFGDGSCDNEATVEVADDVFEVTFR